jgi:hypothetical protein
MSSSRKQQEQQAKAGARKNMSASSACGMVILMSWNFVITMRTCLGRKKWRWIV